VVGLLAAIVGTPESAFAQREVQISVVNQFNGAEYVPDSWVPLRVLISNHASGEPITGTVESTVPTESGGRMRVTADIVVPAQSRTRTTIFAPLGAGDPPPRPRDNKNAPSPRSIAIVELMKGVSKVAQSDVVLLPAGSLTGESSVRRSAFVEVATGDTPELDSYDTTPLRKLIAEVIGGPVVLWSADPESTAAHPIAYDSCRVVMLGETDPDLLPIAQRQALLAYVRMGGTLLISAPDDATARASWLAPFLPARTFGNRPASTTLPVAPGGTKVALREPVTLCEATSAPGATVLIGDGQYVHAAYRPVGLGRIAFTSFPINAPIFTPEVARSLWVPLLGLDVPEPSLAATQFTPEQRGEVLREMIGKPAPARSLAVALAAGFAGIVLVSQLVFRGARRPVGFAVASVVAVLMAGVLAGSRLVAQSDEPLTAGRVALMRFDQGGGLVQESTAFTGVVPSLSLTVENPAAVLRPAMFDASSPPVLSVSPFAVTDAGAAAGRIDRVWQADAPAWPGMTASVVGRFDETGLRLRVRNDLGGPLEAPVLLAGYNVFRLPALTDGATDLPAITDALRNPATPGGASGDNDAETRATNARARTAKYLNTGPIVTEKDILRATFMGSVFTSAGTVFSGMSLRDDRTTFAEDDGEVEATSDPQRPNQPAPTGASAAATSPVLPVGQRSQLVLAGWVTGAAEPASAIIKPSVPPAVERSLVLATIPVTLEPSATGSLVRIDSGFNTMVSGPVLLPVYDYGTGMWLSSSQPGSWHIGFRPPPGVGARLVPTRVTIHGNVQLPVQKLTLRRGQVRNGRLGQPNLSGETVVEWANAFTAQAPVTFDATPADFDATGTVWFLLDVENTAAAGPVMPLWSITELGATIEARVENTEDRR
jgi:hypothetical protein